MNIISKRTGTIIKDGTSLRLTLSDELIDLGTDKEVTITLIETEGIKNILIEKLK